jgi:para-nitrobenzyl esterase
VITTEKKAMNTTPEVSDPATLRRLVIGELIGVSDRGGTHAWRGIRYAAPPMGPLRWRAPQPPAPWSGTFSALTHGPMAPQIAGLLAPVPVAHYGHIVGDEDCLFLNVFAPAFTPGSIPQGKERRPVMVWIHGGGNAVGTSTNYDVVRNLAASDGVIVVTINYRLGVLGWLTHPALQADPDTTAEERSGNFGLLDMLAALGWVRDNISAFGGDPGCVTIFGESAGGQNVLLLMASPLAAGLFHRAIAQSPVAETVSVDEAIHGVDSALDSRRCGALEVTARLWHTAGHGQDCAAARSELTGRPLHDVAAFLRALSPTQLIAAYKPGSVGIYLAPRAARDGVVLPTAPLTQVFASGHWNRVPIILGSNRDEMRTFLADKPEHSRLLFGKLPLLHDRAAYQAESRYGSDAWRAVHVDEPADAMLKGGHLDVWTYRFDWDEAPAIPFIRPDILLGASHGMEMSFVFRDNAGEFDIFKVYTPFNKAGRQQVAQAMGQGWTSFARDGAPTLPGGVNWPRRSSQAGDESLLIDSTRDGGLRMAELRTTMQILKQKLFASPLSAALRCRIYARVFLWAPLFRNYGDEAEYSQWCETLGCSIPAATQRPQMEI